MAKLFAFVALLAFVAVARATTAITTYSDTGCQTATAHYQSTGVCVPPQVKRTTEGRPGCLTLPSGESIIYDECTDAATNPTTVVPSDWQFLKYTGDSTNCDFTTFELTAVAQTATLTSVVIYVTGIGALPVNVTIDCNAGLLDLVSCSGFGCLGFEAVPENTCRNITNTILDQKFSGVQTSCVAPPAAPMAPMAAPTAGAPTTAPVAAPTAAPTAGAPTTAPVKAPVRKTSEAASVVVAAALVVVAAAATLIY